MQEAPTQETVVEEPHNSVAVHTNTLPKAFTLIRESIAYYKQHFATLIGLAGIYTGVSYGVAFLMVAVVGIGGVSLLLFGGGLGTPGSLIALVGGVILLLLLLVAGVWFITWALIALMRSMLSKDSVLSVHESFTQAKPLVWPFLVTSFWSGLASLGVIALTILLLGILIAPLVLLGNTTLLIIGMVIGLIVLVASIIVANTWFIFAQWLVVDGKAEGREATARSKELSKGIFGTVLGRYLVISIAYAIPVIVVSLLCEVAIPIVGPYLSQAIGILVFLPILLIVMARFYQSLSDVQGKNLDTTKKGAREITVLSVVGLVSLIVFVFATVFVLMAAGPEIFSAIEEEYRNGARGPENGAHMMPEPTTETPDVLEVTE